ncbi:hypothetical protein pipiens_014557 [Culex pipiens pipiens]|uniref:Uncharacterized protein n=1 Tax=Culex pipiens pipiens TaxID=38569 RepID=A0ABD1CUN5_CULPP
MKYSPDTIYEFAVLRLTNEKFRCHLVLVAECSVFNAVQHFHGPVRESVVGVGHRSVSGPKQMLILMQAVSLDTLHDANFQTPKIIYQRQTPVRRSALIGDKVRHAFTAPESFRPWQYRLL